MVDLPTGNVHVVAAQPTSDPTPAAVEPVEWVIRNAEGVVVDTLLGTRSAALRRMGVVAFHGASLPLVLCGPDGHPTGDRLPG
jgi:hypothetical protein